MDSIPSQGFALVFPIISTISIRPTIGTTKLENSGITGGAIDGVVRG